MNDDKFLMWKLALNAIHLDRKVTEEESIWFDQQIENLSKNEEIGFIPSQIEILKNIKDEPIVNLIEEFQKLIDPSSCAQLVHLVRVVSQLDGDFAPKEKAIYEKLENAALEGVNFHSVMTELNKYNAAHTPAKEFFEIDNESSWFEKGTKAILKILSK